MSNVTKEPIYCDYILLKIVDFATRVPIRVTQVVHNVTIHIQTMMCLNIIMRSELLVKIAHLGTHQASLNNAAICQVLDYAYYILYIQ